MDATVDFLGLEFTIEVAFGLNSSIHIPMDSEILVYIFCSSNIARLIRCLPQSGWEQEGRFLLTCHRLPRNWTSRHPVEMGSDILC